MSFFRQYPPIRVCAAFGGGIYTGEQIQIQALSIAVLLACLSLIYLCWTLLDINKKYRLRILPGTVLLISVFLCGMMALKCKKEKPESHQFARLQDFSDAYEVVLTGNPVRRKKSWRAVGEIRFISVKNQWKPCLGKILVYIKADDSTSPLQAGCKIIIHKKAEKLNASSEIPDGYLRYLLRKDIQHRVFVNSKEIKLAGIEKSSWLKGKTASLQMWTLETLRKNIIDKNACALAEALLIGYREDMDVNYKEIYTRTGIVHVIAISGMHLGLLYVALGWLLKKTPFICNSKISKAIISLCFLWFFSLLCGATASVLRSAVMFSYLIVGKLIDRKGVVYNALAVSALLLLAIDPYLLWDLGFQLSYAAILGIVVFQKPLFECWKTRQFVLQKIWELVSVTMVAQIATVPLCVYYFQQFPNYFLLSNLIAIPLSTLILFGEVMILLLSPFSHIAEKTGRIIEWLIDVFNYLMKNISEWPGAVSVELYLNAAAVFFLYVAMVLIWCFAKNVPTKQPIR